MKLLSLLLLTVTMSSGSLFAQDNSTPAGKQIPIHITVQNGALVAPSTVAAGPNDTLEITVDNPKYPVMPGLFSIDPIITAVATVTEYAVFSARSSLGVSLVGGYSCYNYLTPQSATSTFSYHPNSNIQNGFLDALQINLDQANSSLTPAHLSCFIVITPDTSAQ